MPSVLVRATRWRPTILSPTPRASRTYPVISALARFGPLSAAQLSEETGIDRSVVSRRATRLEAAGLVERTPDPCDGRAVLLVLTEAGTQFAGHLRRFAEQGPF